jgi:hypothetical protein
VAAGQARPLKKTPQIKLTLTYTVSGKYSNDDKLGPDTCPVEGHEQASFTLKVRFKVDVPPAGLTDDAIGTELSSGKWNESGVRWNTSTTGDCTGGVEPFQCGGAVKVGDPSALTISRTRSLVKFSIEIPPDTAPMGEEGLDSCGNGDYILPYFGLADALDPWRLGTAYAPRSVLAALKKGKTVRAKVARGRADPSWDPPTCNGSATSTGEICTGSLKISKNVLVIGRR